MDSIHSSDEISIANVTFLPGARTFWHTHERGQIIRVVAGSGWVCERGGTPQWIKTGDIAVCPEQLEHWHGADDGSYMTHLVIAHGKTEWGQAVSDTDYATKK